MRIEFCGYTYRKSDGYGGYCGHLVRALQHANVDVHPLLAESAQMPAWMKARIGIQPGALTISCLPPVYLQDAPSGGRHWLISMTEGSVLPAGWADIIRKHHIERVIVPCEHNAVVFREALPGLPVHVVPGGVDPDEFKPVSGKRECDASTRPYTFLALGDRGARKGWCEVWSAFYKAFGTPECTPDVHLIIKARPESNDLLGMIAQADNPDPRITILETDAPCMADVYTMADCMAIPSRSEGFGLPHREFAMQGGPVITQVYSGMDDGHTVCWAIPLYEGKLEPIPSQFDHMAGEWMRADTDELANAMRWCFDNPEHAEFLGQSAAVWIRENQTWDHSAKMLIELIKEFA